MTLKEKVFAAFMQLIDAQIDAYQQTLKELSESAANETKSTAGDKHETALAMLQIEQRNIKIRLQEAHDRKKSLEKAGGVIQHSTIVKGSLVKTDKGYFFLSVALGKIVSDGKTITAISPESPLGAKLLGGRVNDIVSINNNSYMIQWIG